MGPQRPHPWTAVKAPEDRIWYAKATIQHGWSRDVLVNQIESGPLHRHGKAVANFDCTLPTPHSDLARDITKDPCNFDFLTLGDAAAHERDLLDELRQFLLELGVGFAFVGSQYRLAAGNQEFYIDLLFYHLKLRSPRKAHPMPRARKSPAEVSESRRRAALRALG